MYRKPRILKFVEKVFIILWASAIFWFYLGNLVNFHQNRIWGKYLIPGCFTHSSVNKKDFGKVTKSLKNSNFLTFEWQCSISDETNTRSIQYPLSLDQFYPTDNETLIIQFKAGTLIPRGPPTA